MLRVAFAVVLLSTSIGFSAGPVQAQVTEPVRVPVQTDDLNLRSTAGQKTLDRRLGHAADQACGSPAGTRDLATQSAERRCRAQAKQSGSAQATSIVVRQEAREQAQRAALVARASATNRVYAAPAKHPRYTHHRRAKHAVHHQRTRSHHHVRAKPRPAM